ncbi:hypothetical protein N9Z19_01655 [Akkermansiaceae bacterium]|nr:hypothetical protein [Akkermansiaceae bacterium]
MTAEAVVVDVVMIAEAVVAEGATSEVVEVIVAEAAEVVNFKEAVVVAMIVDLSVKRFPHRKDSA